LLVLGSLLYFAGLSLTIDASPMATSPMPNSNPQGFIDNKTCLGCHQEEAKQWQGSHHQKAMSEATEATVLGDFNNVTFNDAGVTSRFFKKDARFFVNTIGVDGKLADFEVKYTFGVQPLQQYLLALPKGRLQAFTVAWDSEKKQWFDLYPNEKIAPDHPAHWTSRAFTANSSCIECHTTNMSLNHKVETSEYKSQWSEANVSCQACHGPGEKHLQWTQQTATNADKNKTNKKTIENKGLVVNYADMSSKKQVETCARCHSRRYSVSENDAHGRSFFDNFMPELLNQGIYHADGQILEEDYVYGSFVQSKMHQKGVSCMDCHNPHTLSLKKQGNALCTHCHQTTPPTEQFASLVAKEYDSPEHHFHPKGSKGAQCVNCHMPEKTYMQIDPRRDHSFSIPRPDLSQQWGTPNACIRCHDDKKDAWAISAMNKAYKGSKWQQRPNIVATISKARAGAAEAFIPLSKLINDKQQADIIRATALSLISQYGVKAQTILIQQLDDDSPLIRATAAGRLGQLTAKKKIQQLVPLLKDAIQGVRIEAFKGVVTLPKKLFDEAQWQQVERVSKEYKAAQLAQSDHPEGHLNLGNLYAIQGQTDLAEKAYRIAIKKDPRFLPAQTNLAQFYYQIGRKKDAIKTFRDAIKALPEEGRLYYSLALLMTEQKRFQDALPLLAKATELLPQAFRIHYNYGLLLQRLNKIPEAEVALKQALALNSNDKNTLKVLLNLYKKQGKNAEMMHLIKQYSPSPN
jgi:predicted CXXCH cytochrome family protein